MIFTVRSSVVDWMECQRGRDPPVTPSYAGSTSWREGRQFYQCALATALLHRTALDLIWMGGYHTMAAAPLHKKCWVFRLESCLGSMFLEPAVGVLYAGPQGYFRAPTEFVEAGDIEQLARRSIRLGRVEDQAPPVARHRHNELSEFADGDVFAAADVDDILGIV